MYTGLARLLSIAYDNLVERRVYECRRFLEKTQWLKKEELQRLQFMRLRALLRHAYENVPYYHEVFRKANLRPDSFKSLEDLSKVPVLKKSVVRENLDKMVAKNFSAKNLVSWKTSGTTAAPLEFYRTKSDLSWAIGAELRGYSWAGYKIGDKVALIWRFAQEQTRAFKFRISHLLKRNRILNVATISEGSMRSFAQRMHRTKPDFIRGYASSTNLFATFMLQNKHFKVCPKAVFTTGETLFPHYRRTIEEAFKCKVYDYYASNEMSHMAAQCGQHEGLHITEENVFLEIVKDDESASSGEEGKIVLTNLHNFGMPLIRYDVGDLGTVFSDTCSCGRELSLVKPVGRIYEYFADRNETFTYLRDFQTIFEDLPIQDFQVVQESRDEIVIKIVRRPGYSKAHTNFILKNVKYFGQSKVKVELVNSIPLEKSGKIRHNVSKLSTKYT